MRQITTMALVLLALPAGAAMSAGKADVQAEAQRRQAEVKALPKGAAFTVQGRSYQLVAGMRAVRALAAERQADTLARAGTSQVDLVEATGPFLIVRQASTVAQASVARTATAPTQPVAVNTASGRLVVVPSSLEVKLGAMSDADAVATAHGLSITSRAASLGMVFLAIPDGADLLAKAQAVAADTRVKSAELELREAYPEAL
jgi:hypothetical protein